MTRLSDADLEKLSGHTGLPWRIEVYGGQCTVSTINGEHITDYVVSMAHAQIIAAAPLLLADLKAARAELAQMHAANRNIKREIREATP